MEIGKTGAYYNLTTDELLQLYNIQQALKKMFGADIDNMDLRGNGRRKTLSFDVVPDIDIKIRAIVPPFPSNIDFLLGDLAELYPKSPKPRFPISRLDKIAYEISPGVWRIGRLDAISPNFDKPFKISPLSYATRICLLQFCDIEDGLVKSLRMNRIINRKALDSYDLTGWEEFREK